jgi:predicted small metal-binding protein
VEKLAKKYSCNVCDHEFVEDRQSVLVEKVKSHAKQEHGAEMEEDEIREKIEDT